MTTLVLARHGRTAWHSPNRYAGRSDIPLDDHGLRQAEALASWAKTQDFTGLACSTLQRAQATIAPTAALLNRTPVVDKRLRELDFGIAEGKTLDEVREVDAAAVERFVADPVAGHFPGGEDPREAVTRTLTALTDLAEGQEKLLVVAHNTLLRLVTCAVLGVPLSEYRRRLPELDPAATVTFRLTGDQYALLAYNVPLAAGWSA
ncbi:histidine phosphatase family protein [Hamadaea sp. NPDC050747]|uniref:histidine phosphatase family protein n=1 Tax=Hamadaea sp. NPDC050747 TaxID=3155789 RepID=UPI0034076B94